MAVAVFLTSPNDLATVTSSVPSLQVTLTADPPGAYAWAEVQLATNVGFTTGVVNLLVNINVFPFVTYGYVVPGSTVHSVQVPVSQFLDQTTYYWRARMVQGTYPGTTFGSYTTVRSFTVTHPPVGSVVSPANDATMPYVGTTSSPLRLNWLFSDPSPGDLQTEFDWDLDIVSGPTNLQAHVLASAAAFEDITILAAQKDAQLRWRVRVKDRHGVQSAYSNFTTFYLSDPPTVAITYPTAGGFVLEPNPTFAWTFGGTRSRTQYKYVVQILDPALGDAVLYSSGEVFSATAAFTLPLPFSLDVGVPYRVRLTVTDSLGLTTTQTHDFQTTYDSPDDPPFTLTTTNYSNGGYVRIAWTNAVEDATHRAYRIYRSDDFGLTYREVVDIRDHAVTTTGITFVKEHGSVTNITAGLTSTATISFGGVPIGDHCIAYVSVDNAGTNGAAPGLTVTDARGNAWTVLPPALNDPGAVNDGVVAYLAYTKVTTALLASDVVTFTWGVSVTAKAVQLLQFSGIRAGAPVVSAQAVGTSTAPSVSTTTTYAGQLVCVLSAIEGPGSDLYTQDADTSNGSWVPITERGGSSGSPVTLNGAFKIVTAASVQSYEPTNGTSRDWATLAIVFDPAGTYTFDDYTAPAHDDVWYYVVQVAERFSQEFEGTSTPASVDLFSEDYWLVSADMSVVVRLWQTTVDDFGDDYEEQEIILIGRGRKYDVGTRIGTAGQMSAQLRDNATVTAREQRFALEQLRASRQAIYMRNPFGDLLLCYIGKVAFSRLAGVGSNEYLDCTIPYTEVS